MFRSVFVYKNIYILRSLFSPMSVRVPLQSIEADAELVGMHAPLLLKACREWSTVEDAEVDQTKAIFEAVFDAPSDEEKFRGFTLADALIMYRPESDPDLKYVMVVKEDESIAWYKAVIRMENMGINTEFATFGMLLMFASSSNRDPYDERTGDDPELVTLSDFFGVWRRHFSDDRIRRVTGREAGSEVLIPRTAETLSRMRREARLLGFEDNTREATSKTEISLDWINPEALAMGFAPSSFVVCFEGDNYGDDEQHPIDGEAWARDVCVGEESGLFDFEEWATSIATQWFTPEYGVYVHETYGPYAMLLRTWGDWDRYLISYMSN